MTADGFCNRKNLRRVYIFMLGMAFAALFAIKSEFTFTVDVPDMPSDVELKETTATTIVVKNDDDDDDDEYDDDDDDDYDNDDDDDDDQLSLTWEEAILKNMTQTKQTQIENYRKGSALMLNIHATHHGGTSFCGRIGRNGLNHSIAPAFACMGDKDHKFPDPEERGCLSGDDDDDKFCKSFKGMNGKTWSKEQTGPYVEAIRPYFHMISWEFSRPPMGRNHHIDDPDWDYPNLLSVIITRDPLSRLLAGDSHLSHTYPGYNTGELNRTRWWDFAAYDNEKNSDNFFLRIVASKPQSSRRDDKVVPNHLSQGMNRTTDEIMELLPTGIGKDDFHRAKDLLDKMTIVLDIACLTEGMEALGNLLGLDLPDYKPKKKHLTKKATPRERIGYEDVYEYLVAKHEWDIALYEYSKTISLLKCDDL